MTNKDDRGMLDDEKLYRFLTKSMLTWWAFTNEQQAYLSSENLFR